MRMNFPSLWPLLVGLALGFSGCEDRMNLANPSSRENGQVAFRLTAQDLANLGSGIDSVRIEAAREGFPTNVSVGSLLQTTTLSNLQPGSWTLKVALYDVAQAIHWYGEATVDVVAGRSVDAIVHLRHATGSVVVHIVLDSDTVARPRSFDTLQVGTGIQNPSWSPLKAWRTAQGVYLVSDLKIPCTWPVLTFASYYPSITDSQGKVVGSTFMPVIDRNRWILGAARDSSIFCSDLYQQHTHFIPWTDSGTITLVTSKGEIVLPGPSQPQPVDTARYTVTLSPSGLVGYLPILSAYRSDSGIHILTSLYCAAAIVRQVPDSGTVFQFGSDPQIMAKCAAGQAVPTWIFVRWTTCRTVQLLDANGKAWILPGWGCTVVTPPSPDTVQPKLIFNGDRSGLVGLPVGSAWRTDSGVYIETKYDCNIAPSILYDPLAALGKGAIQLTPVRPAFQTYIGCETRSHVLFVPMAPNEDVIVANLLDSGRIRLPGKAPTSVDSSFSSYSTTANSTIGSRTTYTLDVGGIVSRVRTTTPYVVDTVVVPEKAIAPPEVLAKIRQVLESSLVRHPTSESVCPAIPAVDTISVPVVNILKPYYTTVTRSVGYANGTQSAQKHTVGSNCVVPASWSALDAVDTLLAGLF